MKKIWVIITNVLIMVTMITFVVIYSYFESENTIKRQIEHFETNTVTMEHVTENYLEGEQGICDVWSHYVNKYKYDSSQNMMTMEEAIEFIRVSHVLPSASAHIIYSDTLTGLSTRKNNIGDDDYTVSYVGMNLFDDTSWIRQTVGESINISRSFTNPVNGDQSIAFCNFISVKDKDTGNEREAILLRVLPVEDLTLKWVFPQEEFKTAELSIIDTNGDYIIKGKSFKNSSFFQFYESYNSIESPREEFYNKITSTTGTLTMLNSHHVKCVLAHTPFDAADSWTLLCLMPMSDLNASTENWLLIGTISGGLLLLFIFDAFVLMLFNRQLRATAKEADSANKAKTDFLSTMSHDIRTPMNAIIGLTTIAEKNIDDKKSVEESLRKISLASNHLLTLINDILDISKVESGKLSLVPQSFSIVETVENLMNLSQPMVKEKNIEFDFHIKKVENEFLYADQLRLNQIYINVLSNAIKYTEPGGSVSVDMKEEASEKPGCVRLTYRVSDTGIGMSKEFMATLYQPFTRQTDSRVNKIQGTGLGLAITKRMVDLMEGTIECESEEGKGTTFTVTIDIPISEHQTADMKLEDIDVLIVDDDEVLLETASDTLASIGAKVDKATGGLEALGMIKHRHEIGKDYNAVIVDLKMPDIDGVETIRRIRSEVKTNTPVLLISAYDWADIEKDAKDAGANGFLSKPLFRSILYDKLSEMFGKEKETVKSENEFADLAGLNILVTEDNDINWEIISTLLSMYGITTERAENGRIAVEKMQQAEKGKYALIFMDIQMPEMNGLEATRAIRKLADPWACSIPIIAMTADAFSENISECLESGMNGHIAKPIDIKIVLKEIRRIKEESKR